MLGDRQFTRKYYADITALSVERARDRRLPVRTKSVCHRRTWSLVTIRPNSTKLADLHIDDPCLKHHRKLLSNSTLDLEKQLRSLAKKERAHLALLPIESLDPGADDVAEHSWLNEADTSQSPSES